MVSEIETNLNAPFIQIMVCSGEGAEKCYPLARALANDVSRDVRILILCTTEAETEIEDFGEFIEFHLYPGYSAVDVRAEVNALGGNAEWIVVLEDHNMVSPDWLQALTAVLRRTPENTSCVIGSAENLTSTQKWSWANFLNVQAFHWHPNLVEPVQPIGFNVAFRRNLLPDRALKPGEFEVVWAHELMKNAVGSTAFPINHVQVRYFPSVAYYNFCNGRVSGAAIRDYHPDGVRHVFRHAIHNVGRRRQDVKIAIRNHPAYKKLPAGTLLRVFVLAFSHSCGAVVGGLFGSGHAAMELE